MAEWKGAKVGNKHQHVGGKLRVRWDRPGQSFLDLGNSEQWVSRVLAFHVTVGTCKHPASCMLPTWAEAPRFLRECCPL